MVKEKLIKCRKKYLEPQRMRKVFVLISIFYLISIIWDVGITYYNYQMDEEEWFERERNPFAKDYVRGNIFSGVFLSLIIAGFWIFYAIEYISFKYWLSPKERRKPLYFFGYVAWEIIILTQATFHISGGSSWL